MESDTKPGGQGEVLAIGDEHHIRAGMKTLHRAFKERWPIPPDRRQRILTVLQQIVETDTFEVETTGGMHGGGTTTMPNHRNQVAAAKVLLTAAKLDQDDQHHLEGKADKQGNTFNINGPAVIQVAGACWEKA